jgi:hypothetical protein
MNNQHRDLKEGEPIEKVREQWLREELHHHGTSLFSLVKWTIGLEILGESGLYFVRNNIAFAIKGVAVVPAEVLPFWHWCYGTMLMIIIAAGFSILYLKTAQRYWCYRKHLKKAAAEYSKINDSPAPKGLVAIILGMFWAFPVIDLAVWISFHAQ